MPLTAEAFSPFGDVLECGDAPDFIINSGYCARYHDQAKLDFDAGRAGISLFRATPRTLPYQLDMMERHPKGSQAFIPMSEHPFLVTVAPDVSGRPGPPLAFETAPGQGINLHLGTWHGVLTPLFEPGLFAVIDRIGSGRNLEEFAFDTPYQIIG